MDGSHDDTGQEVDVTAPPSKGLSKSPRRRVVAGIAVVLLIVVVWWLHGRRQPVGTSSAATGGTTAPGATATAATAPGVDPSEPTQPIKTSTNPTDGATMVWVPAGSFIMGDGKDNDNPVHTVNLDGYWIYQNDVTVAQYRAYCSANGYVMPTAPSWGWIDNNPMVNVSWNDAFAYTAWAHATLPTEAQWEKAARGTDGREYPWGNNWDGSRCANNLQATAAVGSYPSGASPYGAFDMAGNVWQWCGDFYGANYYSASPASNPTGPNNAQFRVIRGDSWDDNDQTKFRAPYRNMDNPDHDYTNCGFRCVVAATSN